MVEQSGHQESFGEAGCMDSAHNLSPPASSSGGSQLTECVLLVDFNQTVNLLYSPFVFRLSPENILN